VSELIIATGTGEDQSAQKLGHYQSYRHNIMKRNAMNRNQYNLRGLAVASASQLCVGVILQILLLLFNKHMLVLYITAGVLMGMGLSGMILGITNKDIKSVRGIRIVMPILSFFLMILVSFIIFFCR
ncbi:hypothetical protein, partial [Bifidobacterium longum]|uniref:hypothetical protein n=1 Tax=Bifidobacterium longum TaxID=216816 RepID=UPI0012FF1C24